MIYLYCPIFVSLHPLLTTPPKMLLSRSSTTVMLLIQWPFLILLDLLAAICVYISITLNIYLIYLSIYKLITPSWSHILHLSSRTPSYWLFLLSLSCWFLLSDFLMVGCPRANCVSTLREPIIKFQGVLSVSCYMVGSLQLAAVRVLTLWKLANTKNHGFPHTSCSAFTCLSMVPVLKAPF